MITQFNTKNPYQNTAVCPILVFFVHFLGSTLFCTHFDKKYPNKVSLGLKGKV